MLASAAVQTAGGITRLKVDAPHRQMAGGSAASTEPRNAKMNKFTMIALVAGLATAAAALPSNAAVLLPNNPNKPTSTSSYDCADEMVQIRRISAEQVDGIEDRSVWLYPVCEDLTVYGRNNYRDLFFDGNANVLRAEIARNATLMNALRAKGYDEHDVISLVLAAGNSVLLYVHQRDMN
jgi:hypothetical protein